MTNIPFEYLKRLSTFMEHTHNLPYSGREFRLLMCIARKSFGYMKDTEWISGGRFEVETGIDRKNCQTLLSKLEHDRIIVIDRRGSGRGTKTFYRINENFGQWQINGVESDTINDNRNGVKSNGINPKEWGQIRNRNGVKSETPHIKESKLRKLNINNGVKNVSAETVYEHFKTHVRAVAKADAIKSISRLISKENFTTDQLITSIDNYRNSPGFPSDIQYRIQANNFFGRSRRFEDYLNPPQCEFPGYDPDELKSTKRSDKAS